MYVALAMGTVTSWYCSSAADMKFRMAPVATREPPFELFTEPRTDIPTPRFFRIVIDKQQGILVLEDPFVQKIMLTPPPRLDYQLPPQALPEQSRELNHSHIPSRYLSGVGTLFLRNTETLVEKPER
jgi:hypothetical protein